MLRAGSVNGKGMAAVTALASVLEWDVIATRVASATDRRAIRNAGIQYMQGFAFAQPMTAIDLEQWAETAPRISLVG